LHGYEMRQRFEQRGIARFTRLTAGALYYALKTLAARGLVAISGSERVGARPERTLYEITDEGRASFRAGMREALVRLERRHSQIDAALSQATELPPDEVCQALAERRQQLAALVDELARQEHEIESSVRARLGSRGAHTELVLRMAVIRRAIAHSRAELGWLDTTLDHLARAEKADVRARRRRS
jgi:DNA-binding PadR family transcriptional regulator